MLALMRIFPILILVLLTGSAPSQTSDGKTASGRSTVVNVSEPTRPSPASDTGSPAGYRIDGVATPLWLRDSSSDRETRPDPPFIGADPTLAHEVFEDFLNGGTYSPLEKINQLASAGGGVGQAWLAGPVYEDAWGVIEAHHGTGQFSRLDLVGKSNNMHGVAVGVGTAYEYQVRFNFANLSDETNRYITFDGFFDAETVDPEFNRGILFRYSDDINDGRFQVVVRESANVETLVDTGIAPQQNVWYRLRITVSAKGDEARFYINGDEVAVITTNLAIGPTNRYTAESNTDRLTGTTRFVSRRFDYLRFRAMSGRGSRL